MKKKNNDEQPNVLLQNPLRSVEYVVKGGGGILPDRPKIIYGEQSSPGAVGIIKKNYVEHIVQQIEFTKSSERK